MSGPSTPTGSEHFRPGYYLNADDVCLLITEHSAPYSAVQIANEHDRIVRGLVKELDALRAQAERVMVLEAEAENRERDAANDRAFNKGSPQAEYGQQCILEIIALSDDLIDLPEVPSINTMRALQHAAMNFHKHGFDLWALGKQLQNRTPMGTVPYATEFECATGLWVVIRDGIISARAALKAAP